MPKELFKDLIAGQTLLEPDDQQNPDVRRLFDPPCGANFRIRRVTANNGNWIVLQLTSGRVVNEDIFTKIQNYLFNPMTYLKDVDGSLIEVKMYENGRWLVPQLKLEYDLDTVNDLYSEALAFNFNDFFARQAKANKEAKERQALSQ
jgi:hypothetical protein